MLDASGQTHTPDLVVTANGKPSIAIEVELTAKSDKVLRSILALYARSTSFTHVIYYVPDSAAESRIKRIAADLRFASGRLVVRRYIARHSRA